MQFAKQLREGVRRGRITCSVRIWTHPHVKAGGRYRMDDGEIQVDSIEPIRRGDITPELARESGFGSVAELLTIARHGSGRNVYLIRFRYIPPGGWLRPGAAPRERRSTAPPSVGVRKARSTGGASEGPGDS